jgi:hypothetical protein
MAKKQRGEKTDNEVEALVGANITQATGWLGGEVSGERARNLDYYYGRKLGVWGDGDTDEEEDGHSRWISTDVQDTIETMMPDLMEIFASSDQTFAFEPTAQAHEEFSEQATDYINYVLWNDNPGYELIHDFFKDGLLQKNGYVKAWWNGSPEVTQETLTGVSSTVLAIYEQADDIEIVEVDGEQAPQGSEMLYPDGIMWSIKLKRTNKNGKVDITGVAPEYMLTSRFTKSMDENIIFAADFQDIPRGDLIADGFDPKIVEKLPPTSGDQPRSTREGFARWRDEDNYGTGWNDNSGGARDHATEAVRIFDTYILMDYDGSGIPKRYNVKVGGQGESPTLLPDPDSGQVAVEVDDHPYVDMTPIRMPHKMIGRAVADLIVDIQDIKSTAGREMLNEMYYANNTRSAISNKVNLDDWLTNRPGGAVRVDTDAPDTGGHVSPIATQGGVGAVAMPILAYMDEVQKKRTGATQSQALDSEALHKTAAGANLILGETQKRLLFIARTCAETGMRNLASKLLQIVVNNQDFERTVRLRGKWVPVRPDRWDANMNVSITVGLGHGTRSQKVFGIEGIMQKQAMLVQQQGGLKGPFVDAANIGNSLEEYVNAQGYRDASMFFNVDPDELQQQPEEPEGPDPAMVLAQAEATKAQAELLNAQTNQAKLKLQLMEKQAELQSDDQDRQAKFVTDAMGRTEDQRQHEQDLAYKYTELGAKTGVEREKLAQNAQKFELELFRGLGYVN